VQVNDRNFVFEAHSLCCSWNNFLTMVSLDNVMKMDRLVKYFYLIFKGISEKNVVKVGSGENLRTFVVTVLSFQIFLNLVNER